VPEGRGRLQAIFKRFRLGAQPFKARYCACPAQYLTSNYTQAWDLLSGRASCDGQLRSHMAPARAVFERAGGRSTRAMKWSGSPAGRALAPAAMQQPICCRKNLFQTFHGRGPCPRRRCWRSPPRTPWHTPCHWEPVCTRCCHSRRQNTPTEVARDRRAARQQLAWPWLPPLPLGGSLGKLALHALGMPAAP